MEFPLRRKQKQRKQNPSPEGTLVLLSASGKSVGLWCSSPPCSPGPSATGSAEGSVERPPLRDPWVSRNVSIRGVPARSMRAASVKPTAHNRGSATCQAWAAPLRWHKGYLRSWMTGGAAFAQDSAGGEGEARYCDRAGPVSLPLPARPAFLCTWASFLSGNLCSARLPPLLGSPA